MSHLRQRLLAAFRIEQREHLDKLRAFLKRLEGTEEVAISDFQDAMRSAHTLKGASRAVSLSALEGVSHRLESVLSELRSGKLDRSSSAVTETLHRVLDRLDDYAGRANFEEHEIPPEVTDILDNLLQGRTPKVATVRPPPEDPKAQSEIKEQALVRVPVATLTGLSISSGMLATQASRQQETGIGLQELGALLATMEDDWVSFRRESSLNKWHDSVLLNRLDSQFRQCQRSARQLVDVHFRNQSGLENLGQELVRQVREARMVPAGDVLGGLGTVARDLAQSLGKQVDYRTQGLDTQVDREVLQQLSEPLLHMIRNAMDHGLETPQERLQQGKSEVGRLELQLRVTRSRLLVTLRDDGRGVQLELVKSRARALGIEPSEDEEALLALLFLPEFSTVAEAGSLSGRGLGLSVLQRVAERVQGKAQICRATPYGTEVSLETPLSITAQNLLLVRCREQVFGLPTHAVERLIQFDPGHLTSCEGRSVLHLSDTPVTVVSLAHALGLPEASIEMDGGKLWGFLFVMGQRRLLLAVDGLVSTQEEVVMPLEVPGYFNPKLSGMLLLKDETVCLVVNPSRLLDGIQGPITLGAARPGSEQQNPRILVVDDSVTTRMLEKSILETQGYDVLVALDGEDALRQLRLHPVDLVISDVQMPRMDGFQLLMAIKANPAFQHLPVILLTSCEDRLDQERGLGLGAEAYLIKQSFDQDGLLETVRQIL